MKKKMKYTFPYWGPFLLETRVEQKFIDILLEKGKESRDKNLDYRSKLAGVIDNEYYYEDYESWFIPKFTPYLNLYIETLSSTWMTHNSSPIRKWNLDSLWINYQKANDYNPPHNHSQDLSFVIYLQVPAELEKELDESEGGRATRGPGTINFDFGVNMPFSINTFFKFPEVRDILIFPAWLTHYVHAFKSDVERISVSGNITFKYD